MERVYKEVEELIEFIKEEMKKMNLDAEDVFLNGNCGNLYRIFVDKFSRYTTPFVITYKGEPYHLLTKIGDRLYDITGETTLEKYAERFILDNSDEYITYKKENFDIKQLSVADEIIRNRKMCNMYRYNDDYDQSEIESEMYKLLELIKKRDSQVR